MRKRERSWAMRLLAWVLALALAAPWNVMAQIPAQSRESNAAGEEDTASENEQTKVTVGPEEYFSAADYMGGYRVRFLKKRPAEGQEPEQEDIITIVENVAMGPLLGVMEGEHGLPEAYQEGGSLDAKWSHGGDYVVAGDLDVWLVSGEFAASIGETEYATLQEAINAAGTGDTILLQKDVEENISSKDKNYTLDMQGHTIRPKEDSKSILYYIKGGKVTLKNGKLTGANSSQGSGLYIYGAEAVFSRLEVSGNTAKGYGNLLLNKGANVTADHLTVSDNTTTGYYGGGIAVYSSTLSLNNSQVIGNRIDSASVDNSKGAGIYASNSNVSLKNTAVSGNQGVCGIGIYASGGELTVSGGRISDNQDPKNTGYGDGGGGILASKTKVTIDGGCRISGNVAFKGGGFCFYRVSSFKISNAEITGNKGLSPVSGAAFEGNVASGETLTFENCTISGNEGGYAVYLNGYDYDTKLTGCTVENNTSKKDTIRLAPRTLLANCTIQNNTATEGVGGIKEDGGTDYEITMTDTVVRGNTGKTAGGVFIDSRGNVDLASGAIYGNHSTDGLGANDLFLGKNIKDRPRPAEQSVSILAASEMKDGEIDFSGYRWYEKKRNTEYDKKLSYTDETLCFLEEKQEYYLTAGENLAEEYAAAQVIHEEGEPSRYKTVQEAINAAGENETVQVISRKLGGSEIIEESLQMFGGKLTLDLNGHTLSPKLANETDIGLAVISGDLTLTGESGTVNTPILNMGGSLTVGGKITLNAGENTKDIVCTSAKLLRIEGGNMNSVYADKATQRVEIAGGKIDTLLSDAKECVVEGGEIAACDYELGEGKTIRVSGGQIDTLKVPAGCGELLVSGGAKLDRIELAKDMPITAAGDYNPEKPITIKLNDEVMDMLRSGKDKDGNAAEPVVLIQPAKGQKLAENLEDLAVLEGDTVSVLIERNEEGKIIAYFCEITAVYLDGVNGKDAPGDGEENPMWGLVPEHPVKTFARAKEILKEQIRRSQESGQTGKAVPRGIYVMNTVTVNDAQTWSLPEGMGMFRYHSDSEKFTGAMARVSGAGHLTLEDITLDGGGRRLTASEALVKVQGGALTIGKNAVLRNNYHMRLAATYTYTAAGGAVYGTNARINMAGGIITGNTSWMGGGILLWASKLTMSGGEITGNRAARGDGVLPAEDSRVGGGVAVLLDSSFEMNGGSIHHNSADHGGGITLGGSYQASVWQEGHNGPKLTMNGGAVSGNSSAGEGGGIYVDSSAFAAVNGGSVTGNESRGGRFGGGGFYVNGARLNHGIAIPGTLQLCNVIVNGNSAAQNGSGLAACATSKTEIYLTNGGAIYGNTGSEQVFIDHSGQQSGGSVGVNWNKSIGTISEFMLGGGAYRWKDARSGEPMDSDIMDEIKGDMYLENEPSDGAVSAASGLGQVLISGNRANTRGGGIGSNGTVIIGTKDPVTKISVTKKWEGEDEEEKDANGTYLTRPEAVRIWLLRDGQRVTSLRFHDRESLTEERWFENLPANDSCTYTLEEEIIAGEEAEQEGACYESTIEEIGQNQYAFVVTNRLMRDLVIKKEAVNEAAGAAVSAEFTFQVELKRKDGSGFTGSVDAKRKDGKTAIIFKEGNAQVKLKAGEEIRLMGLPAQARYTVTEQPEKGYTASVTTAVNSQKGVLTDGAAVQGVIQNGQTELVYRNVYRAGGSAQISATKLLEGREWNREDQFEIQLTEITEGDAGERLTAPLRQTVSTGNRTAIFNLNYTKAGEHIYQAEELAGTMGGITYDLRKYTVQVAVKDNGDGTLNTSVTYPEGDIVFKNRYHASGSLVLKGMKRLTGGRKTLLADDEFAFRVTENGAEAAVGKSRADGSIDFTEIPYTLQDIGTHVYEIREVKGSDSNIIYSDAVQTVAVEVTDSGNGVLNVKASYPAGGIVFENQYVQKGKAAVEVTKRLVSNGAALIAADQTFYVALYSDEACTRLATDIRPLVFKNASSSVVKFSDLEPERTYYVGECDADGNAIRSGVVSGGDLFAANFAQGKQSVVTEADKTVKFTFENEFFQIPEAGFYREGELTITKNLLDADGNAAERDRVFYAGIFADAAHTILSDRVSANVVALDLNGGSSVSEMVTVSIKPGESVTLHVTEVDENGVPVDQSPDFAYGVSIDQTEVTLDESNPFVRVTITNQEAEAEMETELTAETKKETEKKEEKPKTVKTGDDTPVAVWLIIGLLSLCCALLVLSAGRRRRGGV